ncbi:uncharacterized protein TRIADDRAFT_60547 [Trichoplax adhaerens]|uniref:UDP-N-acetylglucosamine 1-carboxyvinyltransferase n=1 Tax=Trichoplax adhaerens TaxID=10228 RepID=B3S8H9_TRIAD|nr:hypothetical protein TRIADDRAFT_60547 [Trichoplax adhaerens]EDV20889.1 hypothetical protein TRIADDRAFT_60547 [Trichoplax adhaerens]|eukprot:XP_002116533.1 hypothetical protein TRIADDRAFT_60547 [Trichoplax adhaerens]
MERILIQGGIHLFGEIAISGSKNSSLPLMAASLLSNQTLQLTNIPKLSDITTMKNLLVNLGTVIEIVDQEDNGLQLKLSSADIQNYFVPYEIESKIRASIWLLGPLLTRFGKATVSFPGGCEIGARPIDLHIAVMQALGAKIIMHHDCIDAHVDECLVGCNFSFTKVSVGATINAILAAVLAKGETNLFHCAREPEIADLCRCLNQMGAEIKGIGTTELTIIGKDRLDGTSYKVMPDRIEAGTYMIAAAVTRGDVKLLGIECDLIENLVMRMKAAGVSILQGKNFIRVKHQGPLKPVNISTQPHPGFPTDLQAQFMCLMTLAEGLSTISETIFENRFMHVRELCKMGANITIDGHDAVVQGVQSLVGAEVMASDLRASAGLVIAGLCARGETTIRGVHHLDRGYQSLEKKLSQCGAKISRITGD